MESQKKYKIITVMGDSTETDEIDHETEPGWIICKPPVFIVGSLEECEHIKINKNNVVTITVRKTTE
jgi:hypothetical protein